MTYHKIYFIFGETTPLTLYEACKRLLVIDNTDWAHVRCKGRTVAFLCGWRNEVRPMFQASEKEKELILAWKLKS